MTTSLYFLLEHYPFCKFLPCQKPVVWQNLLKMTNCNIHINGNFKFRKKTVHKGSERQHTTWMHSRELRHNFDAKQQMTQKKEG